MISRRGFLLGSVAVVGAAAGAKLPAASGFSKAMLDRLLLEARPRSIRPILANGQQFYIAYMDADVYRLAYLDPHEVFEA